MPTAHAAPDLSTSQGRFVNLIRVLAHSGRLNNPDEVGRLLGTRFRVASSDEHHNDPASCAGEPAGGRWIRSTVTATYAPAAPFWFTDEMRAAGQLEDAFGYTVTQVTRCDGVRYAEAKIQFSGVSHLFCVHAEDVKAAAIPGLWGGNPLPGNPWGLTFDGWAAEETGSGAILDWPHIRGGNVNAHEECLTEALVRQDAAFSARVRKLGEESRKHPPPVIGPGSGTALGDPNGPVLTGPVP